MAVGYTSPLAVEIQLFGTLQDKIDLVLLRRKQCADRGYHVVGRELVNDDLCAICTDCELFFDVNDPTNTYKVASRELS